MKKILHIPVAAILFIMALTMPKTAYATPISASSAAFVHDFSHLEKDNRAEVLRAYLEQFDSPLAASAETFIQEADNNQLDWKLVVSIAGVESWFGHRIPPYSNNGWGYGVYGNNVRRFASWDEAITIISSDIREKYMNKWKATDIDSIGRIYAADPRWSSKVQHFMNQIEAFAEKSERATLSLSI